MQFFLYEIAARIVAIYLCFDCSRKLWHGLVEREIAHFNPGFLDWWSNWVAHRDAAPVQYWIQIGIQISILVACLFVAIFGWWQPNTRASADGPTLPIGDVRFDEDFRRHSELVVLTSSFVQIDQSDDAGSRQMARSSVEVPSGAAAPYDGIHQLVGATRPCATNRVTGSTEQENEC